MCIHRRTSRLKGPGIDQGQEDIHFSRIRRRLINPPNPILLLESDLIGWKHINSDEYGYNKDGCGNS